MGGNRIGEKIIAWNMTYQNVRSASSVSASAILPSNASGHVVLGIVDTSLKDMTVIAKIANKINHLVHDSSIIHRGSTVSSLVVCKMEKLMNDSASESIILEKFQRRKYKYIINLLIISSM